MPYLYFYNPSSERVVTLLPNCLLFAVNAPLLIVIAAVVDNSKRTSPPKEKLLILTLDAVDQISIVKRCLVPFP
jgi:hypothetical protein